ncbi:MAG: FHA domain-containing protein [Fimbriimonadaceae bacterium]|nr:FHA domain-containing protein [Fimbriimonadaceae bacterium]QYK56951.1 MAG: FHA domain-containing protein [Fimbriimonadaceae bacterium]
MSDPNKTMLGTPPQSDPNKTVMGNVTTADPNRTIMGQAPSLNTTVTIKPVQCPVCKAFNPPGVMYCNDCGLIFEMALDGDAFGAPSVRLPVLVDSSGREHQLRPGANVLGRAGDVAVEDTRVSRRHAEVTVSPEGLTIADLGSTNGTAVNGARLGEGERKPVASGDKVSLGGFEFTVSTPGESSKTIQALSGKTVSISAAPTTSAAVAFLDVDGLETPLELGTYTFGRKSENDIVVSDPYVSGRHGQIDVTEEGVFLTDTGSTNGTLLNEAKLTPNMRTRFGQEDVVRLGAKEIRIRFKK